MKIAIAQIQPEQGDLNATIKKHQQFIKLAIASQADAVFFSELSLTGYAPTLAEQLSFSANKIRATPFQRISNQEQITIGVGLPTSSAEGIRISMAIFQPNAAILLYDKQQLHQDELPYFVSGNHQLLLDKKDHKIAPAICYESLQITHAKKAARLGATLYLASVAKSQGGLDKARKHYPLIANRYNFPVLMANCIGSCEGFKSVGQSAVWDETGQLLAQLDSDKEGIIVYDTNTKEVEKKLKLCTNV